MSITPGLVKSVNLYPPASVNYVEKIVATTTPGTLGTVVYDAGAANNFTFQYVVQNYVGAGTYVGIYINASLDGENYLPVTLPYGPTNVGIFTEYVLGIDSFKVPKTGNGTGTIILPNQFSKIKISAYTDAGSAELLIFRSSPSIS